MQIVLLILCILLLAVAVYLYRQLQAMQREQNSQIELRLRLENSEQNVSHLRELQVELEDKLNKQSKELEEKRTQIALLEREREQLECELKEKSSSQTQIADLLEERFKGITTQILEERSQQIYKRNEESLRPLREDLKRFGEQVDKVYNNEARERLSLQAEIRQLVEQSNRISSDTNNLTQALRGNNKQQGNWGEMILEDLLQKSGLERDIHYSTQERHYDEESDKTFIPDVIVNYPNGGRMIIDSKVNLKAYMDYVNAEAEDEIKRLAKLHLDAVRTQIKDLSDKHYQQKVAGAPDFVILFIPNEPAYFLALKEDANLWNFAYDRKILLMNTSNLMATLKLAEELWRNEKQRINVQDIFKKVGALYDQFVLYLSNLEDIASNLEKAQKALEKTQKSLSDGKGNVLRRFEDLKKLGAKSNKQLQDVVNKSKGLSPIALDEDEDLNIEDDKE